jgi:MSHA biogenesis protein MshK
MSVSGASAWAQIIVDPTRPPTPVVVHAPEGAAPGNQLQSVMISPTRRAAIINGVVVELGGKYGDAVLMRVAEDEVVLGSGDSRQVLKLHPGVDKIDLARAEPAKPAAAESASRKATPKAEARPKPKAKAKPTTRAQGGAKPAADGSAGTR